MENDKEAESKELVSQTVKLPITVEAAIIEWKEYQELTRKLLDETDYQPIGKTRFKKKSAWRKYARAFNISDKVVFEEIIRSPDGFPTFARIRVQVQAPNGRTAEADQECHVTERCGYECNEDCNGRHHWAHPGDLPATALTRAKNRAISDLIGAGEVSAEEMEHENHRQSAAVHRPGNSETKGARPTNQQPVGEPVKIQAIFLGVSESKQSIKVEIGDREPEWMPIAAIREPRSFAGIKPGTGLEMTINRRHAEMMRLVQPEAPAEYGSGY